MTTTRADPTVDSEIKGEIPATVPSVDLTLSRYVEDRRELSPGHAVRLLRNGEETFPVWLAAIETARHRISLEMYIFNDDAIGRQFAEALGRAARRGVEVRVMYDYVGCRATPAEFFTRMRVQGVHIIAYHKYRFWRPRFWALIRRNHRKTLVCDGRVAFTGGLNIAIEWVGLSSGGGDWRDAVIQVEGPAVATIEAVFLRTWNRRAKKWARLDPARLPQPAPAGDAQLVVISNSEMGERFAIRRAALHAVRESRQRIYLANPYFVPDRGVLQALQHAARRGVDVRLLLPGESDSRILDLATRATLGPLLAAGVRIWQSKAVVHTKVVAVDDVFVSIGSYNFDHRSLAYNLEVVVNVLDAGYGQDVVAFLESDIAASEELTREGFGRRPLLIRLMERLAYSLRKWL
jgi:cardiolipin synthase A/B